MPVFFKQYGEQRTGTNYLKRLLELNFEEAVVFGSILGWKHGLFEWGNGYEFKCTSHKHWLDHQHRGGVVYSVDDHPLEFSYDYLQNAISQLNYIVTIKDIYQWLISYKNFHQRYYPWSNSEVKIWCVQYISNYSAWADLLDQHGGRVIHHSSLILHYKEILESIQRQYRLTRRGEKLENETFLVNASTDLGLNIATEKKFNTSHYKKQFTLIPREIMNVVEAYLPQIHSILERLRPFEKV